MIQNSQEFDVNFVQFGYAVYIQNGEKDMVILTFLLENSIIIMI